MYFLRCLLLLLLFPFGSFAQDSSNLSQSCQALIDLNPIVSDSGLTAEYSQQMEADPAYETLYINQLLQTAKKTPWEYAAAPYVFPRKVAWYLELKQVLGLFMSVNPRATMLDLDQGIEKIFATENDLQPLPFPSGDEAQLRKILLAKPTENRTSETGVKAHGTISYLSLCTWFKAPSLAGCTSALKEAFEAYTSGPKTYNLGNTYLADILTGERAQAGAVLTARKILAKLKSKDVPGDLFSDTFSSYREVGMSEKEAEKWTWDLLLLSFIHGQNGFSVIEAGLVRSYNVWTIASSLVISAGAVFIDSQARERGWTDYSLPKKIKTSCDNGRNYHFWANAYAARYLVAHGHSQQNAAWGSYLLDVAYQMLSQSLGRSRLQKLRSRFDEGVNQSNRLDLSFVAAGISYGLHPEQEVSVDQNFKSLWLASKRPAPNFKLSGRVTLPYLVHWTKMMEPRVLMEQFREAK